MIRWSSGEKIESRFQTFQFSLNLAKMFFLRVRVVRAIENEIFIKTDKERKKQREDAGLLTMQKVKFYCRVI